MAECKLLANLRRGYEAVVPYGYSGVLDSILRTASITIPTHDLESYPKHKGGTYDST